MFTQVLIFVLIFFLVAGCNTFDHIGSPVSKTPYDKQYKKVEYWLEVASQITDKDDGPADNWQLPPVTEKLSHGDCDDKAIYLYSMLTDLNTRLLIGNLETGDPNTCHMWVNWYVDDKVYILDPTNNYGIHTAWWYGNHNYEPLWSFDRGKRWKH
jgi:predicted small secreted protein